MKTIGLKIILVIFLLQFAFAYSQNNKLVKLLNKELKKELKRIEKNPDAEKFEVVQFYQLQDSIVVMEEYQEDPQTIRRILQADLKILSVEIKKKNESTGKFYTEKQEVNLGAIEKVQKDINILFTTQKNAVLVTTINENGEKESYKIDQFFLQLNQEKNNEDFADMLIKYFRKSGYFVEKGVWAD
ncbi:hypothetical protein [Chryseobacterium sp.]|uniref:hypothetical protein n=1 Tax=Chryseobacterium sp. TaxID=1871047 RepID=UPI002FC989C8